MNLSDLMDPTLLDEMLAGGYVRLQVHPSAPYTIVNYTEKAQWERVWNDVTRQCRGLIFDRVTGEVMARPFPKFFNHGEPDAPHLEEGPIRVYDKLDGSLGILYRTPHPPLLSLAAGLSDQDADKIRAKIESATIERPLILEDGMEVTFTAGYAIATRGSFTSDQAQWATQWLDNVRDEFTLTLTDGVTYLFEILYPQNRIVVDYGGKEALVLLDIVDNETGQPRPDLYDTWPGERVEQFEYGTVLDVLAQEPRENSEGFVIFHENTGHRVKVKYDEYVRLHKLLTGVTARTVWELLVAGKSVEEMVGTGIPDEFHDWLTKTAAQLQEAHDTLVMNVNETYEVMCGRAREKLTDKDPHEARKTFAGLAQAQPDRAALFMLYDGNDAKVDKYAWQRIKPAADKPYNTSLLEAP